MLGRIFGALTLTALIFGIITGRIALVGAGAVQGAARAVELSISLAGSMCLWSGVMRVLQKAGLSRVLTKIIRPLLKIMYPTLSKSNDAEALDDIAANMSANLLGLGNAATPLGLRAMEKLKNSTSDPGRSTNDMNMLVLTNCAAIQLIPTTLLALRSAAGSAAPASVVVPIWISSAACFALTVALCRMLSRRK